MEDLAVRVVDNFAARGMIGNSGEWSSRTRMITFGLKAISLLVYHDDGLRAVDDGKIIGNSDGLTSGVFGLRT